ncbi:Exopolysaccharide production protein ExoY [Chlamydiales bacterium STE3]|nr:Exopolysaccharide production protein ExoY [Chlamydiales bacterium STE3]
MSKEPSQLVMNAIPFTFSHEDRYPVKHYPFKRSFDIAFSLFALIAGFPLFLTVALLVRFSSKGKLIYSHERVGRGGKTFRCYKFRTMFQDADQRLKEILAKDTSLKEEWNRQHKLKNDPRVTPVGAFLRKTSLDELPQFWNVLMGDLSVVGPRPVVKAEVQRFLGNRAPLILSVRPGLTGIWQVSGRSNTSYDERLAMDEEYIGKQSMMLDLKLIMKTIPAMLFTRGAY